MLSLFDKSCSFPSAEQRVRFWRSAAFVLVCIVPSDRVTRVDGRNRSVACRVYRWQCFGGVITITNRSGERRFPFFLESSEQAEWLFSPIACARLTNCWFICKLDNCLQLCEYADTVVIDGIINYYYCVGCAAAIQMCMHTCVCGCVCARAYTWYGSHVTKRASTEFRWCISISI